jgi:cell division septal protein FtsQ
LWGSKRARPWTGSRLPWLIRLISWMAPGLVLVIVLAGGLYWFLRDHSTFHVVAIRVYGAERVPQAELMELAQITRGMSLLRIDVGRVRTRLLQHRWIRDALVRRMYPNELEVIVYERRPAALLESGSTYLIDGEGYILGQPTAVESASLPRLVARLTHAPSLGQRLTDAAVGAGLRLLDRAHDSTFFRNTVITHVEIIHPERFLVQTQQGRFIVGSSLAGLDEKLEFFAAIDEVLRTRARRAEYIDVSGANHIVVKTSARTAQGAGRLQRRGGSSGQVQ